MIAKDLLRKYRTGERNFCGVDLIGISLRGADLREIDLSDAVLTGVDLRGANLERAKLAGANLYLSKTGTRKRWVVVALLTLIVITGMSALLLGVSFATVSQLLINPGDVTRSTYEWDGSLVVKENIWLHRVLGFTGIAFLLTIPAVAYVKGIIPTIRILAIAFPLSVAIATIFSLLAASGGLSLGEEFSRLGITIWSFLMALSLSCMIAFFISSTVTSAVISNFSSAAASLITLIVLVLCIFGITGLITIALYSTTEQHNIVIGILSVSYVSVFSILTFHVSRRALSGDRRDRFLLNLSNFLSSIGGTNFGKADLTDTNFSMAIVKNSHFKESVILRTKWHLAEDLHLSRVYKTILCNRTVLDLLVSLRPISSRSYSGLNLYGANLDNAQLSDVDLTDSSLNYATLVNASLERSNLTRIQALGTNFFRADITAACLQSWNIDNATQLKGVVCRYIYLLNGRKERRPSSEKKEFTSGEFASLFEEVFDTIDLIFRDGVDWQAFFLSFQELRHQYSKDELSIQAVEKKSNGSFIIRLEVSQNADKASIEDSVRVLYEEKLSLLEQRYRSELQAKDSEISIYKQQGTDLLKITELLASRTLNETNQIFNAPVGSVTGTNYGSISVSHSSYSDGIEGIAIIVEHMRSQVESFPDKYRKRIVRILSSLIAEIENTQPCWSQIDRCVQDLLLVCSDINGLSGTLSADSGSAAELTISAGQLIKVLNTFKG